MKLAMAVYMFWQQLPTHFHGFYKVVHHIISDKHQKVPNPVFAYVQKYWKFLDPKTIHAV